MLQPSLPIANGFYKSKSLPVSAQDCRNFFPYYPKTQQATNQAVLFPTPGITQEATTGSTDGDFNRGAHKVGDYPYFVNGSALYRLNSDGTTTNLGEIEGSGRASMADNGTQMMIVVTGLDGTPSSKGYILDTTDDLLGEIMDEDFYASGNPQHVVYVDGYFLCTTDSKKFIISSLGDGEAWNALDFGSAESDPDVISVPAILNNQVYIFGSETIEAFANRPVGADFPFVRTGVFADKGTIAPYSVIKAESKLYFVGNHDTGSPGIWAYGGGGMPEKVSSEPIDSVLQGLTSAEIEDIFSWTYSQDGFHFVAFTLPSTCFVYDIYQQAWHERKSRITWVDGTIEVTRCRVNSVVSAYGKLLVGDVVDGRIGSMDPDVYAEYSLPIPRRVTNQPFKNQQVLSFTVPYIELTMESGTGNADDTNPQIELSRSTDDGRTWSTPMARPIGKVGEYRKRQIWRRLGRASRSEIFAFETAAKVKVVLINLAADIVMGYK